MKLHHHPVLQIRNKETKDSVIRFIKTMHFANLKFFLKKGQNRVLEKIRKIQNLDAIRTF